MAQIGEMVAIGLIDEDDVECPFEHDIPPPPDVKNEFVGEGSKLGDNMEKKKGTHNYAGSGNELDKRYKSEYPNSPDLDPRHRTPPLTHVKITVTEVGSAPQKINHDYPVTCAAHHLIPAQASLKKHQILIYMCKGAQAFKSGKTISSSDPGGIVWGNVGYNVNGAQNGLWLPGLYAVAGNGTKQWSSGAAAAAVAVVAVAAGGGGDDEHDADDDEDPALVPVAPPSPVASMFPLTGTRLVIKDDNRKWAYVRRVMGAAKGQFHDSHNAYSTTFVKGVLDKIAANYQFLKKKTQDTAATKCSKCQEAKKKYKEKGVPTPYGLVNRLNNMSMKLSTYLNTTKWRLNIFTSKWCQESMKEYNKGNKAASLHES